VNVSLLPGHVQLSLERAIAFDCAVSPRASVLFCAAFFRLIGLAHRRFIALKACILVQCRFAGIGNRLAVGNLLVVDLAGIGLAQVINALVLRVDDHYILVAMGLFLAAVMQSLFLRVFWPLAASLGAVYDQVEWFRLMFLTGYKLAWVTLRKDAAFIEGSLQYRQQMMNPIVDSGLTQFKHDTQQLLQRICFQIDQREQQLLCRTVQRPCASATCLALAGFANPCLVSRIVLLIGLLKAGNSSLNSLGVRPVSARNRRRFVLSSS
jgi:hypothetical protein